MNSPTDIEQNIRGWHPGMTLEEFRLVLPLNNENVYQYFFEANLDRIKVQNAKLALPKIKQILEATFKISQRGGFHAMSLRDLCREADISMGGMYNYISSKEELSKMVTEFVGVTFSDINLEFLPPREKISERLEAVIRAQIYMTELFQPWYFFVYMEAKNLPSEQIKRAMEVENNVLHQMRVSIDDGIETGIFRAIDSAVAASAILAMVQNWYLKDWHFRNSDMDATRYAKFVLDAAHGMLGMNG